MALKAWIFLSSPPLPYSGPYSLPCMRVLAGKERLAKAPGRTTLLGIKLLKRPPMTCDTHRVQGVLRTSCERSRASDCPSAHPRPVT